MSYDQSACTPSYTSSEMENKFIIYPNPTTEELNLYVDKTTILSYQIFDSHGSLIQTKSFNNKTLVKINTSSFMKGVYFVEVKTELGTIKKKFIVK